MEELHVLMVLYFIGNILKTFGESEVFSSCIGQLSKPLDEELLRHSLKSSIHPHCMRTCIKKVDVPIYEPPYGFRGLLVLLAVL